MAVASSVKSASIVEVLDRILDKGIVIDVFARISIVGIELVTIEARIVIASVEKYLIYVNTLSRRQAEINPPQVRKEVNI